MVSTLHFEDSCYAFSVGLWAWAVRDLFARCELVALGYRCLGVDSEGNELGSDIGLKPSCHGLAPPEACPKAMCVPRR